MDVMKTLLLSLVLLCTVSLSSQVNYAFVDDAEKVDIFTAADDTTINLNEPYKYGEWIIYFDAAKKHKAAHFNFSDSLDWDTTWYINGQLHSIYQRTEQHCHLCYSLLAWYIDGTWRTNKICNADSCVEYTYYSNGQINSITKSVKTPSSGRNMTTYYQMGYHSNGVPRHDFIDTSGRRQRLRAYHFNGTISLETTWQRGSHVGPFTSYYENGQVWMTGQYAYPPDDGKNYPSKKIGKWSYYKSNGELVREEFFENDGFMKETLFYENGKLVKHIFFDHGKILKTVEY